MSGIIIMSGKNVNKVENIYGYLEMRMRKFVDRFSCQVLADSNRTVIFNVKTSKKNFKLIKEDLLRISKECVILEQKTCK